MRKAFRHSGVLMMVAVVALGLLGAAYTLWYEDLTLNATVSTGTLDADMSIHDLGTAGGANGLPVVALPNVTTTSGGVATLLGANYDAFTNANFGNFNPPKPQPFCDGAVSTDGSGNTHANDAVSNNALTLVMSGLYPYAGCEFETDIHNSGTIPFHIALIGLTLEECTDGNDGGTIAGDAPGECTVTGNHPWSIGIASGQPAECAALLSGIGTPTLGIVTSGGNPVQIHTELACKWKLILDQDANAEGKTYKFSAEWRAFQWNETPTGPALNTP